MALNGLEVLIGLGASASLFELHSFKVPANTCAYWISSGVARRNLRLIVDHLDASVSPPWMPGFLRISAGMLA